MLSYREKKVWNVYFLFDTTSGVNKDMQRHYETVFSKIIHKYRSNSRLYETCFINIVSFGNDEPKFIIENHPFNEPIHLNLKFSGDGSMIDGIKLIEESLKKIETNRYYSPIIILFTSENSTNLIEENLLTFNSNRYYRPFHYDYPEIFINEFIDEMYIVLFNSETYKTYNSELCNLVFYENVSDFGFEGEIKEKNEINLRKIYLPQNLINIII